MRCQRWQARREAGKTERHALWPDRGIDGQGAVSWPAAVRRVAQTTTTRSLFEATFLVAVRFTVSSFILPTTSDENIHKVYSGVRKNFRSSACAVLFV